MLSQRLALAPRVGRAEGGRRGRDPKRLGPAELVEASGMAVCWSIHLTANWSGGELGQGPFEMSVWSLPPTRWF